MKHNFRQWWLNRVRHSLRARALILSSALLLVGAIAAPVAFVTRGVTGLLAAGTGLVICLMVGFLGQLVGEHLQDPQLIIKQVLGGMVLRMGLPLAACMAIHAVGGPLKEAGTVYYILVFYLVMLLVDTMISSACTTADKCSRKA